MLGSADFDVIEIDPQSLMLESLPIRTKNNGKPQCSIEDVNSDGYADLVCHFMNDPAAWEDGMTSATLTGRLFNGMSVRGSHEILLVPWIP